MGALITPGLTGSPNYFGLMNNLVTLINCESLKEIDEIACVTPSRSSLGQTLNCITSRIAHQNSITTSVKAENWRARFSLVKGYSKFLGNLRKIWTSTLIWSFSFFSFDFLRPVPPINRTFWIPSITQTGCWEKSLEITSQRRVTHKLFKSSPHNPSMR